MISSQVQRTLVKSPPELWAEISDPASLARHLGEFGEIRITRVEPEQRVEWEAGDTSGSVVIKPSGWGTKVRLTVTRELPELPADDPNGVAELGADVKTDERKFENFAGVDADEAELADVAADHVEPQAALLHDAQSGYAAEHDEARAFETDDEAELVVAQPDPEPQSADLEYQAADLKSEAAKEVAEAQAAPQRRRGFFARLFGRRRVAAEMPAAEREPSEHVARDARAHQPYNALTVWAAQVGPDAEEDFQATHDPDAVDEHESKAELNGAGARAADSPSPADCESCDEGRADDEAAVDISAEIEAAEEVAAEEVTAVLTGVLDRLGAAHHRPFSRA